MREKLTYLHPVDMAWLLALLEGGTLFAMGLWVTLGLSFITGLMNNILLGAFVGFLGTIIALLLWKWRVRGKYGGKPLMVYRFPLVHTAVANSVFLIVLFTIQDMLPTDTPAILGFLSVAIALVILIFIYNRMSWKFHIRSDRGMKIAAIDPFRVAFFAGIYEAIILPLMGFLQYWIGLPPLFTFTISGFVAGLIGGFLGTVIFNILAPYVKPWIDIT